MATNIESTQLDFNNLKETLKTYFAASSEFADYDFEGAALSNILDVLAYNTHFNALTANMAINESFLETAQLRGSAVTHAHSLGYYPRSKTTATATINVNADLSSFIGERPTAISLPLGTRFTATVENISYTFQTRDSYTAIDNGSGAYSFIDENGSAAVKLYEGIEITRTFLVPDASDARHYVINDESIDTTTAIVKVFLNKNTTEYVTYNNLKDAIRITNLSRYYLLQEAPNGFYELQFTDNGNIGLAPVAGNKVEITYLRTKDGDANGARLFTPQTPLNVVGQNFPLTVTTSSNSTGGAPKESAEEIKFHAPLGYATQRRLVTAEDYHISIQTNYPSLEDVTAWGGEENVPVNFGKIYISLKHPDDTPQNTITATEDNIITNLITPLGTMSISPIFVDPTYTYLGLDIRYDFNPTLSGLTIQSTSDRILSATSQYFVNNLGKFEKEFRRSNLLQIIDAVSPAVLSSTVTPTLIQRFEPVLNISKEYIISFPVGIALPDDLDYILTSSRFIFKGQICVFRNALNTQTIEIVNGANEVLANNIGNYESGTGKINLVNFNPEQIVSGLSYIKLKVKPAAEGTIRPLRNYIILKDDEETSARGNIDYQINRVSL